MKINWHSAVVGLRLYLLRKKRDRKIMDLHALSCQQMSDLYLGDHLLGEIRQIQRRIDLCMLGRSEGLRPFSKQD